MRLAILWVVWLVIVGFSLKFMHDELHSSPEMMGAAVLVWLLFARMALVDRWNTDAKKYLRSKGVTWK